MCGPKHYSSYFKGQFLPGNLVLGGKFCLGIRFLAIFDKMCNI